MTKNKSDRCEYDKDGACEAKVCYSSRKCGARDPLGNPIYKDGIAKVKAKTWQGTVMDRVTIEGMIRGMPSTSTIEINTAIRIAQAQAEISFEVGMRIVVEFVEKISQAGHPSKFIPSSDWQAQLKVWFKDNPELLKKWGIDG